MIVTDPLRGAYYAIASAIMFATMGVAVRTASGELPNEMLVFFRNSFGLLTLLPWVYRHGGLKLLPTQRFGGHLLRALAGLTAMYLFFYAIAHLKLAEAVLLNYTSPLFTAPIALIWLRERLPIATLLAVVIGFIGVGLILKPGTGVFSHAAVIGLISGFFAALAMVSIRRISATEPTIRTVFYFSSIATLVSAVPLWWCWQTPSWKMLGIMAVAGFFATKGQLLLTKSYSLAPAAQIGAFTYVSVLFAGIYGWLLWREQLDEYTVVGAVLIVTAGALALRRPG